MPLQQMKCGRLLKKTKTLPAGGTRGWRLLDRVEFGSTERVDSPTESRNNTAHPL